MSKKIEFNIKHEKICAEMTSISGDVE